MLSIYPTTHHCQCTGVCLTASGLPEIDTPTFDIRRKYTLPYPVNFIGDFNTVLRTFIEFYGVEICAEVLLLCLVVVNSGHLSPHGATQTCYIYHNSNRNAFDEIETLKDH